METKNKITKSLSVALLVCLSFSCSENDEIKPSETAFKVPSSEVEDGIECVDENPQYYTYSYIDPNGTDVGAGVNATIDDRTCVYNYAQVVEGGITKGVYRIKAGSNHIDDTLQPRIERAAPVVNTTGDGSFVKFSGYATIKEVGYVADNIPPTSVSDKSGTYLFQGKGKHTGGGGSAEPAIGLILAKPVFSGGNQVSFDIYREQIKYRGGSGNAGREMVYLTNVPANTRTYMEMENGFSGSGANMVHYINVKIGNTSYNWNVPEPERATQAKIRFGAYRVKGGEAEVLWDGVSASYAEIP